jgi:SulP family sulfate permease
MGEWREFARLRRFSLPYRTILLGTFTLTVVFDLTVAVETGLVLACVFFVYRMGSLFRVRPSAEQASPGVQSFELYGSLFFGAVLRIEELDSEIAPGTHTVVLRARQLISMDTTGLDALMQLRRALLRRSVRLVLSELNEQPLSLVRRSGFEADLCGAQ